MTIELQNPEKAPTDLPSLQLQQMMMMMRPEKNLKEFFMQYIRITPPKTNMEPENDGS